MSSPSTPKEDNPRVPISNLATGTRGDHWRAVILVSRSLETAAALPCVARYQTGGQPRGTVKDAGLKQRDGSAQRLSGTRSDVPVQIVEKRTAENRMDSSRRHVNEAWVWRCWRLVPTQHGERGAGSGMPVESLWLAPKMSGIRVEGFQHGTGSGVHVVEVVSSEADKRTAGDATSKRR